MSERENEGSGGCYKKKTKYVWCWLQLSNERCKRSSDGVRP